MYTYRFSTNADYDDIRNLLGTRFGDRDSYGVMDNLENRYYLAINETGEIVAMTGIIDSDTYNGLEVDWTCVDKNHTGNGLITTMLSTLLTNVTQDVYCSCWRVRNNPYVNLSRVMENLGFNLVRSAHKSFMAEYNNCKSICVQWEKGCHCYEDLYVRRYNES